MPNTAAGLSLPRFLEMLSSLKIPVVEDDAADRQEDLANAHRWPRVGSPSATLAPR